MRKIYPIILALLLYGCASAPPVAPTSPQPATTSPADPAVVETAPEPAAVETSPEPAVGETAPVPAEAEVCLQPDDASGVLIDLYKPGGGHSAYRSKPGWTIASIGGALPGAVLFPRAVDPNTVQVVAEPTAEWDPQPLQFIQENRIAAFTFTPTHNGGTGWVNIRVEAKDTAGQSFSEQPVTLRVYKYTLDQQHTHPYMVECWTSIQVPETGDH